MRKISLLLAAIIFLFVDKPVSTLQMDIDTAGDITGLVADKDFTTNRLPDGKLRVVIWRLNRTEFTGRFASISMTVRGITNVVGADKDANAVQVRIATLGGVNNLTIK